MRCSGADDKFALGPPDIPGTRSQEVDMAYEQMVETFRRFVFTFVHGCFSFRYRHRLAPLPPFALPQRRHVRDVMLTMPCVPRQRLVECQRAPVLGVVKRAAKLRRGQRSQEGHPTLV